ncbi:hypothetical protein PORY_001108 [Pneumocystis oryctolagi]|uniref:Uncharacterized protein n=1 Tax=Pneumocystis oryctolagi TaxID=42067 RepID=A0ACB7CCS4_9ASCO|nr:hypothetical protein PORY_001108 [Pneumocystis oryctolagi]
MECSENDLFQKESDAFIPQENMDYDDPVFFLKTIFPQQHLNDLQHILHKHENILEEAVDELLSNMDKKDDQDLLDGTSRTPKAKKRKKYKKIRNIPLYQWHKDNVSSEHVYCSDGCQSPVQDNAIPDIEWLSNLFEIPKKQILACYQGLASLQEYVYALLSSEYMIERMNQSFSMLEPNYMNNLDQLRKEFPFLEEYMYERVLLSVNNDLPKAKRIAALFFSASWTSPVHSAALKQYKSSLNVTTHTPNTLLPNMDGRASHTNTVSDGDDDDDTYSTYNLEECEANVSTFVFKRNHAFKEASKAYKKAKTHRAENTTPKSNYGHFEPEYAWPSHSKTPNPSAHLTPHPSHLYTLDLHGLVLGEAEWLVKKQLAQWWQHEQSRLPPRPLHVITGIGIHSKNHRPTLRPAILQLLAADGWAVDERAGRLVVLGRQP